MTAASVVDRFAGRDLVGGTDSDADSQLADSDRRSIIADVYLFDDEDEKAPETASRVQ